MQLTAELRWFYRGTMERNSPSGSSKVNLHLAPPEEREDLYLYSPECEYLGIKLRQGRLEIKWRKVELGVVHFEIGRVARQRSGANGCEDPSRELKQQMLGKS